LLLRHVVDDVAAAFEQIGRHPNRGTAKNPETSRLDRVRHIDAGLRRSIAREPQGGLTVALSSGRRVRGYVEERRPRPTLDTPEHRWLAAQLSRIRRQLARIRECEAKLDGSPGGDAARGEISATERKVAALERLEPMRSASREPKPGFVSLQLLKSPGYREAYLGCLLLSFGLNLDGDALR